MKNKRIFRPLSLLLALAAFTLALTGCSTATSTELSASYQTPQAAYDATVGFSTNGVDLSGSYATTNQTISGAVNLHK